MNPLSHRLALGLGVAFAAAAMLGLSCRGLPTFLPDLAHRPERPLPVSGAQGPLSAAQSRAIRQRLQQGGQPLQTLFERDPAASDAIELAAWQRRGPVLPLQEWFGRLWETWR